MVEREKGEYMDEELLMSARTAITRNKPSLPIRIAESKRLLHGKIIDYGCGKGADVEYLSSKGYDIVAFDPYYAPNYDLLIDNAYDVVLCTYVLNTVFPETRNDILSDIHRILKNNGIAIITVRDVSEKIEGIPYKDGVITKAKTFQKFFTSEELVNLVSKYFEDVEILNAKRPLIVVAYKSLKDRFKEKLTKIIRKR